MRVSQIFMQLLIKNKKVKVNKEDIQESVDNFWYTFDVLNHTERFQTVLENGYSIADYEIHQVLSGMVFPSAVTVVPGNKYVDYLSRKYSYATDMDVVCEDVDYRLLSPQEFKDEFIYLMSLMKVTLNDDDFKNVNKSEIVFASADFFQFNGKTSAIEVTQQFPIPVTLGIVRSRYDNVVIDDEWISEYLTEYVFNKLLVRSK